MNAGVICCDSWGVVIRENGEKELAPIYDNGNCLNSKWDDEKMQTVLSNEKNMETEAFSARRCIFELEGRKLNPYHLMERMEYEGCNTAVRKITPKVATASHPEKKEGADRCLLTRR